MEFSEYSNALLSTYRMPVNLFYKINRVPAHQIAVRVAIELQMGLMRIPETFPLTQRIDAFTHTLTSSHSRASVGFIPYIADGGSTLFGKKWHTYASKMI